jgi:hypothetical protein
MTALLSDVALLLGRIGATVAGFETLAALDDYPNGGDFEADTLPACFIGDSGDKFDFSSRNSLTGLKDAYVFASVIVERKAGAFEQSKTLLNAVVNAVLYTDDNNTERWLPDGFSYPFNLGDTRPEAMYYPTFIVRNIIFTVQQSIS